MLSANATLSPVPTAFAGTRRFTCSNPATDPGTPPAYKTSAGMGRHPMSKKAETGKLVLGRTPLMIWPSSTPGAASPPPVPKMLMIEPLRAGLDGELTDPSSFRIAP